LAEDLTLASVHMAFSTVAVAHFARSDRLCSLVTLLEQLSTCTTVQPDIAVFGSYIPARLVGDGVALTGALGGALMLAVSKLQRSSMVLSVWTTLLTAAATGGFLLASCFFDTPPPAPTLSPRNGRKPAYAAAAAATATRLAVISARLLNHTVCKVAFEHESC
jgi:drug/metabolite transporter (DMT)-like permease